MSPSDRWEKNNLLWHENHPKQVMMICAMLEAKVLFSVQSNLCPNDDCLYVSSKVKYKCCDFCEVPGPVVRNEKNKNKWRRQISLGVTLCSAQHWTEICVLGYSLGVLWAPSTHSSHTYLYMHMSSETKSKRKSVKWRKTNVECYALGVLWTAKRFVWRLQFFCIVFFFLCDLFQCWSWMIMFMFLLYTSVSVYY